MNGINELYSFFLFNNRPLSFQLVRKFLLQFYDEFETYNILQKALILGFLDRDDKNRFFLSNPHFLIGEKVVLATSVFDGLVENENLILDKIGGCYILSKSFKLPSTDRVTNFSFKSIVKQLGHLEDIICMHYSIDKTVEIGFPFNPITNQFEPFSTNIANKTLYFKEFIPGKKDYFFSFNDRIFQLPNGNREVLEVSKSVTQIELPNKFFFNRKTSTFSIKDAVLPIHIERLLSINHISNLGSFSNDREYYISEQELIYLNQNIFKSKLNICYE